MVLQSTGETINAIECFDQVISFDSQNFSAYFNKGVALKTIKEFKRAIENFDLAI